MVQPVPDGFRTITPHLTVRGCAKAIEFYRAAFGAEEIVRMPGPDGESVMYAELKIGDSRLMLNDEFGEMARAPETVGGTSVCIHVYVPDCNALYDRAVAAGATATMPPMDMFWGDRYGKVKDPFGHEWAIATHTEDVPPEEMAARAAKQFGG